MRINWKAVVVVAVEVLGWVLFLAGKSTTLQLVGLGLILFGPEVLDYVIDDLTATRQEHAPQSSPEKPTPPSSVNLNK